MVLVQVIPRSNRGGTIMSKELAEAMDLDPISEESREEFEELMEANCSVEISKERLDEIIEKSRNGEYVTKEVDSWEELWDEEQY